MFKRISSFNNNGTSLEFSLPLNNILPVFSNEPLSSDPKELMLAEIKKQLAKNSTVENPDDFTSFKENYTKSAFFTVNKEFGVYFPNEKSFIEHTEITRQSLKEKNSIWKDLTIDSFYLAYLFSRDYMHKDSILIRMNYETATVEYAVKNIESNCMFVHLIPLSSFIHSELEQFFGKSIHGSFPVSLKKMAETKFKKDYIDYAFDFFEKINDYDLIFMNKDIIDYLDSENITLVSENHIHTRNHSGMIRRFTALKDNTIQLELEISCESGLLFAFDFKSNHSLLKGNVNSKQTQFSSFDKKENNPQNRLYTEEIVVFCKYQLISDLFYTLDGTINEMMSLLNGLDHIPSLNKEILLYNVEKISIEDFHKTKEEIKALLLKKLNEFYGDENKKLKYTKEVDDFIELLQQLIKDKRSFIEISVLKG